MTVIIVALVYILVNVSTRAHRNELAELAGQVDSLESALAHTVSPQGLDEQMQSLTQKVEFLRNKIDSELEASEISMEAMREANNRIFLLFVFLSGVGSLFGLATWYGGRQEQQEEKGRDRAMFALQEKNLEEVNTITTAIAAGATQNVESLNTMLSTFQRIMDFKISEAVKTQKEVEQMQRQFEELEEARRQQVEELLKNAVLLRRSRFQYTNPDPNLQQRIAEFRTQMDLMQRVILDRYTGAKSPTEENRDNGEIYLRRGVIAYYDNDMFKSREMLRIAERFFPPSEPGIERVPQDQRLPFAFTQFYLALIEKNYGQMSVAKDHIEKSYALYGLNEQEELLTPTTRAEILSYLGDMDSARAAIQDVLDRAANLLRLRREMTLQRHDATCALRARLILGNTYYVRGEWQEARMHYQDTLEADVRRDYNYYAYYSIAQVHHQLGNEEKAKENKHQAYKELVDTRHLQTKVALDTRILLNSLAYLCTREDEPEKAKEYRETIRELWLRIREVNGLQLRLFSFEKKRPISKDEFWAEVFRG